MSKLHCGCKNKRECRRKIHTGIDAVIHGWQCIGEKERKRTIYVPAKLPPFRIRK